MTDHPPQAERLVSIQNGWQEAARQEQLATWEPTLADFEEEAALYVESSDSTAEENGLLSALREAHHQAILAENKALVYGVREWGLGLRAFVGDGETE